MLGEQRGIFVRRYLAALNSLPIIRVLTASNRLFFCPLIRRLKRHQTVLFLHAFPLSPCLPCKSPLLLARLTFHTRHRRPASGLALDHDNDLILSMAVHESTIPAPHDDSDALPACITLTSSFIHPSLNRLLHLSTTGLCLKQRTTRSQCTKLEEYLGLTLHAHRASEVRSRKDGQSISIGRVVQI